MCNDKKLIPKFPLAVSSTKANILTKMGKLSSYLQNKYRNNFFLDYVIGYLKIKK